MKTEEIKQVTLKPGKYSLQRERDGAGDSGPVFVSIAWDEIDGHVANVKRYQGEIRLGCSIECGSLTARSYSAQDFWLTTKVTEILEVNEDKTEVKFKTGNSVYIAKSF